MKYYVVLKLQENIELKDNLGNVTTVPLVGVDGFLPVYKVFKDAEKESEGIHEILTLEKT